MPRRISPRRCRICRVIIWASTGCRASPSSRSFPGRPEFNSLTDGHPKEEKARGTEPAPFGGQTAVQRRTFHRVALIGGASALAVIAVAASISPSPAANSAPAQTLLQPNQVVHYEGGPTPPSAIPAHYSDYIRASGLVGANLTDAMRKAGVPERIGREYVGVLRRAIRLEDGLSVDDKFDLVYEPGAKGRLLYVGIDRVARADVELLKWT